MYMTNKFYGAVGSQAIYGGDSIYLNKHYHALGYNEIIEKLKEHALSERAKDALEGLEPYMNEETCVRKMAETTAARRILDSCGSPPLPSMTGLEEVLTLADSGAMLVPEQLMRRFRLRFPANRLLPI